MGKKYENLSHQKRNKNDKLTYGKKAQQNLMLQIKITMRMTTYLLK